MQIEGFGLVCRGLVVDALYLAALLLLAWFVIGVIVGFLSLTTLFGAGGLAAVAQAIGRFIDKAGSRPVETSGNP